MSVSLSNIKVSFHKQSLEVVNDKIKHLTHSIGETSKALHDETKSSAGDKYETGREMIKQELDKLEAQLLHARRERQILVQIDPTKTRNRAELGSLVTVSGPINYFLSISGGKCETERGIIHSISPMSPIGQAMLGLKTGDTFTFAGKPVQIESVV